MKKFTLWRCINPYVNPAFKDVDKVWVRRIRQIQLTPWSLLVHQFRARHARWATTYERRTTWSCEAWLRLRTWTPSRDTRRNISPARGEYWAVRCEPLSSRTGVILSRISVRLNNNYMVWRHDKRLNTIASSCIRDIHTLAVPDSWLRDYVVVSPMATRAMLYSLA